MAMMNARKWPTAFILAHQHDDPLQPKQSPHSDNIGSLESADVQIAAGLPPACSRRSPAGFRQTRAIWCLGTFVIGSSC